MCKTQIVPENELELMHCENCGSDNVLTAKADCLACEGWRNMLLAHRPDLASEVHLT